MHIVWVSGHEGRDGAPERAVAQHDRGGIAVDGGSAVADRDCCLLMQTMMNMLVGVCVHHAVSCEAMGAFGSGLFVEKKTSSYQKCICFASKLKMHIGTKCFIRRKQTRNGGSFFAKFHISSGGMFLRDKELRRAGSSAGGGGAGGDERARVLQLAKEQRAARSQLKEKDAVARKLQAFLRGRVAAKRAQTTFRGDLDQKLGDVAKLKLILQLPNMPVPFGALFDVRICA